MKWGKNSNKAGEKLTQMIGKVFGVRGISILLGITAFALLVSAMHKWI